jgi:Ala-tRNA(Pro) deacylase
MLVQCGRGRAGDARSAEPRHDTEEQVPAQRSDLFTRLDQLGIATRTVEHPAVFTVAESAALDREIPGGHTKNLFLKDAKGRLFLIIAHAETQIDLKRLPAVIGSARLSFGRPELLMDVLGVTPGSVTAFALINDAGRRVDVVMDRALMTFPTINCHPLVNSATTSIARDDLLRFIRACGHEPTILYVGTNEGAGPAAGTVVIGPASPTDAGSGQTPAPGSGDRA